MLFGTTFSGNSRHENDHTSVVSYDIVYSTVKLFSSSDEGFSSLDLMTPCSNKKEGYFAHEMRPHFSSRMRLN